MFFLGCRVGVVGDLVWVLPIGFLGAGSGRAQAEVTRSGGVRPPEGEYGLTAGPSSLSTGGKVTFALWVILRDWEKKNFVGLGW